MNTHKNASLTPKGRAHLVSQIASIGLIPAARAAGVNARTARKWQRRFATQGTCGLTDRSSHPVRSPRRSDPSKIERAVALQRTLCLSYAQIAERVGLSSSFVARACQHVGVARLPPLQEAPPVRRYERPSAGQLLHLDTKKLARFDQPGHQATGDRTRSTSSAGWQALHVAIENHSRVGLSLMLPDETAKSACQHLLALLQLLQGAGCQGSTGDDRQRLGLQIQALCQTAAKTEDQAPANPALHAQNQWQGRALLPDLAARVGLRLSLSHFRASRPGAGTLDASLQLASPSLSYCAQTSRYSPGL